MGNPSDENQQEQPSLDVAEHDCVGCECSFSDSREVMPVRTTALIAEKTSAWFAKEYDDEWSLRILTCRVATATSTPPFSSSVIDAVIPKNNPLYNTVLSSEAGGSNVSSGHPTRFVAQTPKDGGPFCSFALTTTDWHRGLVRGTFTFNDAKYDCTEFIRSARLYSGWRSGCWQIQVLPVAFLAAHVSHKATEIAALNKRVSLLENIITEPRNPDDDSLDFGMLTRKLHECHTELFRLERRQHFESGLAKNIAILIAAAQKDRASCLYLIQSQLDLSENLMEAQSYDLQSLPKRIESQRVMIFNLILQRDARMNLQIGRTNMEIADTSRRIAEASMRDSASMKTIAILTMVFLPGTAVASFFSMTMFNWEARADQSLASSYIWIYFVTSIPLTAAVLGVWYLSIRRRREARERKFVLTPHTTMNTDTSRHESAFDREDAVGVKQA